MINWFKEMYTAHTGIALKMTQNSDKKSSFNPSTATPHLLKRTKERQDQESEEWKKKNKQKEELQEKPTTALSSKSNWFKFWKLKNGITIYHYSGYIELTDSPFIDMWDIDIEMDRYNARGIELTIHVSTDMAEEEFITALHNDGNLD